MNTYILLDDSNVVLNTLAMGTEPVDQTLINTLIAQGSGERFIRLSNDQDDVASVESVTSVNNPDIGSVWDGVGFLAPSPGPQFMLDHTGYNWIPVPPDINDQGYFRWDSENTAWVKQ